MNRNKWTMGLIAVGAIGITSVARAEEKTSFVQDAVSGTTISGYVDTSVEWAINPNHSTFGVFGAGGAGGLLSHAPDASTSPLGIPFRDNKQNGFNLNVVELNISKPLDETPWASGYNVSLLFGPDATGYNTSANATGGQFVGGTSADFAIKDANIVLRAPIGNGLEIKVGVFDTVIGYEVFEAGSNPNFTRSWGYAIEPTQHTGLLFTYHVNDNISVSAGIANTLMSGINTRDNSNGTQNYWEKTALASLTMTAPQSWGWLAGSSFSAGMVYGFNGVASDALNIYAGITVPTPVKGLAFGVAFDYLTYCRDYDNFDSTYSFNGARTANHYFNNTFDGKERVEDYSVALYGTWQATEKLSLNVRGEYFHANYNDFGHFTSDAFFYSDGDPDSFDSSSGDYSNNYQVDVWSITGTVQYNLWANVLSRLEIRYDEACYKGGNSQDQLSLYLNIIYKF